MADLIARPLRFVAGRLALVDEASDAGVEQQIALLAGTRRGERDLVPAFGVSDPAFRGVDLVELNAGLQLFGPAAVVEQVVVVRRTDTELDAELVWSPLEPAGAGEAL